MAQQRVGRGTGRKETRGSAILTLTGRTGDEVWEVETDLKRVALTRASDQGKPLRVLEAEVEGDLALGRGDHVGVGQAHLQLKVVLCFVAKTIPGLHIDFLINLGYQHFTWDVDPMPTQLGFLLASLDIVTLKKFTCLKI